MESRLSNRLFIIKALGVFTIVLAHTPINYLDEGLIKNLVSSFAMSGVPIFFILSGYFYQNTSKSFYKFWESKINSIIIPWLIAGVLNYGKRFINGFYFRPIEIIGYVIGYKSFFYYLTVLLIFYLLYWRFKNNKTVIYCSIVITVVYRYLLSFGLIDPVFDNNLIIFKWTGFFALGMLMSERNIVNNGFSFVDTNKFKLLLFSIICIIVSLFINQLWLLEELSWITIVAIISGINNKSFEKLFVLIGKVSFSIYLYHQFLTTKFFVSDEQLINLVYVPIRPALIVIILTTIIAMGYYISYRISKRINSLYVTISGARY